MSNVYFEMKQQTDNRYLCRFFAVLLTLFCCGVGVLSTPNLMAQTSQQAALSGTISAIQVRGNQRVDTSTILTYLGMQVGEPFNQAKINVGFKRLFATGLFRDVVITREGAALVVTVQEHMIINRIAFEGNDRFEDDELNAEISLRPRGIFTPTKARDDAERLLSLYQSSGRLSATVEPKIIQAGQNRVDLVFEINEGVRTRIKAIQFIGNRAYSDRRLRDVLISKEAAFYRFFTASDTYDPEKVKVDEDLLRQFYTQRGYADFNVVSSVAELTPTKDYFILTFTVDEGVRYRFGDITVSSTVPGLDVGRVRGGLSTIRGDIYNAEKVTTSITYLIDEVGDLGFAFVDVEPELNRDPENKLLHINYKVQEGPKVYVERIEIEGNDSTREHVIRREIQLIEGDAFNVSKLRRSRQRLQSLGFFETVSIEPTQGTAEDKTILKVEVAEAPTGEFQLGAGYSTAEGVLGNVKIVEKNFLGRGQRLALDLSLSSEATRGSISFTEPYLWERPISGTVRVFYDDVEREESRYNELEWGATVGLNYRLSEYWRQGLSYTWKRSEIEAEADASSLIRSEEGTLDRSIFSHNLVWNRLDNNAAPTDGWRLSMNNSYVGIGGDVNYVKNVIKGEFHYPIINDNVILSASAEYGRMDSFDDTTYVSDRFFLGGSKVRGFDTSGIGPRDSSGASIGGTQYYAASAQVTFPLPKIIELNFKGRAFVDAGSLWDPQAPGFENVDDSDMLRASYGVGFIWDSPLGPLAFDFGWPIQQEDFDRTEVMRLSFETAF